MNPNDPKFKNRKINKLKQLSNKLNKGFNKGKATSARFNYKNYKNYKNKKPFVAALHKPNVKRV